MTHVLHQFLEQQPGEGELRVNLARMAGEDYVAVPYDDAKRGWVPQVYRCTVGGTVLAVKARGNVYRRRKDALAEAESSGIPFMPGFRK
jgi:hypothetical protein